MSLGMFFGVCNFMFGMAGLNVLGGRRYLFGATFVTGVSSLAVCVPLVLLLGGAGAGVSFVFAEALLLAIILWKYLSVPCTPS
jgi:hypothetical protein